MIAGLQVLDLNDEKASRPNQRSQLEDRGLYKHNIQNTLYTISHTGVSLSLCYAIFCCYDETPSQFYSQIRKTSSLNGSLSQSIQGIVKKNTHFNIKLIITSISVLRDAYYGDKRNNHANL